MDDKFTVGLITLNQFGVLNRIAGLFAKRGYNIESIAAGETENPLFSRITIVSSGDEDTQSQVVKQLQKLHDVKRVYLYKQDFVISVEHMLIKLNADSNNKAEISEHINVYGGKVMDFGGDFITVEVTGDSSKLNAFIKQCEQFGILELCRSGAISMVHGTEDMLSVKNL